MDKTINTEEQLQTRKISFASHEIAGLRKILGAQTVRLDGISKRMDGMDVNRDMLLGLSKQVKYLTNLCKFLSGDKPVTIEYTYDRGEKFLLPQPARDGSIGDDLVLTREVRVKHGRNIIPLNFIINLPPFIEAKIEARSGFSAKGILGWTMSRMPKGLLRRIVSVFVQVEEFREGRFEADVLPGKIDPGYFNPIGIIINNRGPEFVIPEGTHLAQITYYRTLRHRYREVESIDDFRHYVANRGGGFGHTDEKTDTEHKETEPSDNA